MFLKHDRNKYLQEKSKHEQFRKSFEQEKEHHVRLWKKELDEQNRVTTVIFARYLFKGRKRRGYEKARLFKRIVQN